MQPLQCDLQPQLQETQKTTHTDTTTHCRTQRRNRSRPERPQPYPPHRRGTFHRRLQPFYTEKRKVSCSGFLHKTKPMQHSCSHYNAICNHSFKKRIELRAQTQPLIAERRGGTDRVRNGPSRTRRTDEVPFIVGCRATLHGKTQKVSCSGFLPKTKPMQHSCSHYIAIGNHRFKRRIERRTQTQPFIAKHRGGTDRVRNDPSRTRRTDEVPFYRRLQPLYTEKHKVSCCGFLPKTKPMQHSCSHYNAICNHSFKKRKKLRTQTPPLIAEHRGGTDRVRNDPSRTRRTGEVPFIVGCSHFTRKNARFRAPASSPKHSPCNIHAAITMRSATTASRNA